MRGKNLTAKLHQSDAFTISGFEPRSTLAFKAYSAAVAAGQMYGSNDSIRGQKRTYIPFCTILYQGAVNGRGKAAKARAGKEN